MLFALDRSGLCGPDGPTHHGVFDNTYLRSFPNMTVMAPGDQSDVGPMIDFAIGYQGPASMRYPKATAESVERPVPPVEHGKAEIYRWGTDGMFVVFGSLFPNCVAAAEQLRSEGLDIGVINARFAKPLDTETILRAIEECGFVITVEESTLCGGFGSAVLEAAATASKDTSRITRLGVPDQFVEHGDRNDLLHDLDLSIEGLVAAARRTAAGGDSVAADFVESARS